MKGQQGDAEYCDEGRAAMKGQQGDAESAVSVSHKQSESACFSVCLAQPFRLLPSQ